MKFTVKLEKITYMKINIGHLEATFGHIDFEIISVNKNIKLKYFSLKIMYNI